MSEWNHSAPIEPTAGQPVAATSHVAGNPDARKRKWTMLVAGTLGIVLVAGILFQIFRAEPGKASAETGEGDGSRRQDASTAYARVDGYVITRRQVADECIARHGREVLDNLINRTIIQQACAERKIVVTPAEVKQEVIRIAKRFNLEPANWYQMLQAERGITPLQYHNDIIWPMLALKKIAGTKVSITEDELKKAFIRDYGPRAKLRVIMLDNFRRAKEVHTEVLRNPRDFDQLAQKHSIEPNSRALGGEIPPVPRFGGNPKFEEAAFRLRKGQISPVVQIGNYRFVIMVSDGFTKPKVTDMRQVRDDLIERIREDKVQTKVAQVFEKLRREARVDNFLTNTSTGIKQASGTKSNGPAKRRQYPLPSNIKRKRTSTIK